MLGFMSKRLLVLLVLFQFIKISCVQIQETSILRKFCVSYYDCKEACRERPKCKVSKYTRRCLKCELFTDYNTDTQEYGVWLNEHPGTTQIPECLPCLPNEVCTTNNGSSKCIPSTCTKPAVLIGATTFGNMFTVGSKFKYLISDGNLNDLNFRTVTCLSNGSWVPIQSFNKCAPPDIPHGTISVVETPSGLNAAEITCEQAYELRQKQPPTCNPTLNVWNDVDDIYCDRMIDGPWRKIYSYPGGSRISIISHWTNANHSGDVKYSYRNNSYIDKWKEQEKRDIKVSIVTNDTEVAFISFNGIRSNIWSWFKSGRLLNSSWTDLKSNADIQYISWGGRSYYENNNETLINLRHYISKVYSETNCSDHLGWFVVTWTYMPCDGPLPSEPVILYSKHSTASRFVNSEIGVADRFEVWVN